MDDKIIETYLGYLTKLKEDKNYQPSTEENTAIYNINNDVKYSELASIIFGVIDPEERIKRINEYSNNKEIEKAKDDKSLVSKIYGVDVKDIESLKLNNEKKVFTFFDKKLDRKRIIENLGTDSLIARLKEIQNNNVQFQGNDYKKNSNDILKNEAENNNNRQEFKMVEIDEYLTHPGNYGPIDEEIINKLKKIKDSLKIVFFNIENKVALTKDNRVIEIIKDKEGNYVVGEPKKLQSNVDKVDNEDENMEHSEDVEILNSNEEEKYYSIEQNDFEEEEEYVTSKDIEDEIEDNHLKFDETTSEIKSNIKKYYDDPSKIEEIKDEKKKSFYEKMVNEIYAVRKAEYEKKKSNKAVKVYKKTNVNNKGFITLLFVSILLLAFAVYLLIGF